MRRYLALFLLVAILIISGFGYLFSQNGYRFLLFPIKVTVGPKWVNQAQFAGIFTGIEEGIFRKHGIEVTVKEFSPGTSQIDDLLAGRTDFAIMSAEEFLTYIDEGKKITAIGAIYQVSPYAVVSLAEKNIKSPADFKGKILGSKAGKLEEELIYKVLLKSVGLGNEDAQIVELGFESTEYDDLAQNDVDVVDLYRTDQLYFFDITGVEYNIIYPEQFGINAFNDVIVTRDDSISERSDLVKHFMSALIESWEFAIANQEQAVNDTLKHVTNESYKNYDYQLYILQQSIPLLKPDSNTVIGAMTKAKWEALYKSMLERGLIGNDVQIEKVFTVKFLE